MKKTNKAIKLNEDTQAVEVKSLTPNERESFRLRKKGLTYDEIGEVMFKRTKPRQTIYEMIRRAERKLWRIQSKRRYSDNPGECPIDEAPLPARARNALKTAGYERLGQLAGLSPTEIKKCEGIGREGAYKVIRLLQERMVRKPHSYCVSCGAPLNKKLAEDVKLVCECGTVTEIKSIDEPREAVLAQAST